mgnify:CR=1 FL=1
MKKALLIIGIIVVLILAMLLFIPSGEEGTPTLTLLPSPSAQTGSIPSAEEVMVDITSGGFSPSEVTIPAGITVRFTNKDASLHWPAAGIHPTHQVCPGFDSLKGLQPGESYSFTFTEKKTCPMNDHLNPQIRGSIIVQ